MAVNNMISYSQHIWNDMRNIIQMIIDEHGKDFAVEVVREGRRCRQDPEYVAKLLSEISDDISEFINRTNRNRPAFIRKLTKECSLKEQQIAWFYALVLISMHQVREFIEVRDMYRDFITPGKGNRVTAAALSGMLARTRDIFTDNEFPEDAFDDFCLNIENEE